MKTFRPSGLLFLWVIAIMSCISPEKAAVKAPFSAENEKIFVDSIDGISSLKNWELWPHAEQEQQLMLSYFSDIHKRIHMAISGFEKYGRYQVVDQKSEATVIVSTTIIPKYLSKDSIYIQIKVDINAPERKGKSIREISASGVCHSPSDSCNGFVRAGMVLGDYSRNLPYSEFAGLFYSRK